MCAEASLDKISDKGIIIFDDTERSEYNEAIDKIVSKGFKRLDFWGIAPGAFNNRCTSIFYREGNIFDI